MPSLPPPPRYVGVLQALPAPQAYGREYASPARKDAFPRFVWGALVTSTMVADEGEERGGAQGSSNGSGDDRQKNNRCVDASAAERCLASGRVCAPPPPTAQSVFFGGLCVNASARYVPSYSLRVGCVDGCGNSTGGSGSGSTTPAAPFKWGEVAPSGPADDWMRRYGWPEDPMWTESDWPYGVPSVKLYLAAPPGLAGGVLGAGVGVREGGTVESVGGEEEPGSRG